MPQVLTTPDRRRTFLDYRKEVQHEIGLESGSSTGELDVNLVINDALEHIAAMHEWNWLSTGQNTLDIVADQAFVILPADFGTLNAIEHDEGFTREMIPTSWSNLLRLRQGSIQEWSRSYWYVVQTGNVESGSEEKGLDLPTIELYPTPAESQDDAIKIVYRRFLRRLKDDDDFPMWPGYMDRALSLLARAMWNTDWENEPQSAVMIQFQQLLPDLKVKDGLDRRSFGVQRGGLWPRTTPISPFYPRGIPDPTSPGSA